MAHPVSHSLVWGSGLESWFLSPRKSVFVHAWFAHTDPGSLQAWNSLLVSRIAHHPWQVAKSLAAFQFGVLLLNSYVVGETGVEGRDTPPLPRKATPFVPTPAFQDSGQCHTDSRNFQWQEIVALHLRQSTELKIRVNLHQGRCLIKAQVYISSSMACWQNKKRQKQTRLS